MTSRVTGSLEYIPKDTVRLLGHVESGGGEINCGAPNIHALSVACASHSNRLTSCVMIGLYDKARPSAIINKPAVCSWKLGIVTLGQIGGRPNAACATLPSDKSRNMR